MKAEEPLVLMGVGLSDLSPKSQVVGPCRLPECFSAVLRQSSKIALSCLGTGRTGADTIGTGT